jgi:hypothetical protein
MRCVVSSSSSSSSSSPLRSPDVNYYYVIYDCCMSEKCLPDVSCGGDDDRRVCSCVRVRWQWIIEVYPALGVYTYINTVNRCCIGTRPHVFVVPARRKHRRERTGMNRWRRQLGIVTASYNIMNVQYCNVMWRFLCCNIFMRVRHGVYTYNASMCIANLARNL